MSVLLTDMIQRLRDAGLVLQVEGDPAGVAIEHLAHDSREVSTNGLFVAIRGEHADGHDYIERAIELGAVAVAGDRLRGGTEAGGTAGPERGERAPLGHVVLVSVADARAALAELAFLFYGHPSHDLDLIGVTGTNGKTTVSTLLYHTLEALGHKAGLIGTVETRIGGAPEPATHTTPDALALSALLRRMAEAGCDAVAMEVSSHALAQERVRAQRFAAAGFTNLTHDHLDYHGSVEEYRAAKKRLFDGLAVDAAAVVNRDDPEWEAMVADTAARVVTIGQHEEAHVRFEILEDALTGLKLRLDGVEFESRLVGQFNAYNLALAYALACAVGYEPAAVREALEEAPPPPGRFEALRAGDGTVGIVDYAHTPDALENVLRTARETLPEGARLHVVFGCGGDRDRAKRPEMAAVAERLADRVTVTDDNPRTEPGPAIVRDILEGFRRASAVSVVPDRADAIRAAVDAAAPGDVVVVAGKGHEDYQVVGTERRPFSDRAVLREAFTHRAEGGSEHRAAPSPSPAPTR